MTIQGAMKELVNLLNADDIPIYYKGGIKKVIETIDDYIDGKDDYVKRKAEQTEPQKMCDAYCNEDCTECAKEWQDWKDQMWTEAVIASKTEPKIFICPIQDNYEALIEDEPQTDCAWK